MLSPFDVTTHYVPGRDNVVADALSRWAYPASGDRQDVCRHRSAEDWKEVLEMDRQEGLERQVLVVTRRRDYGAAPEPADEPDAGDGEDNKYNPTTTPDVGVPDESHGVPPVDQSATGLDAASRSGRSSRTGAPSTPTTSDGFYQATVAHRD